MRVWVLLFTSLLLTVQAKAQVGFIIGLDVRHLTDKSYIESRRHPNDPLRKDLKKKQYTEGFLQNKLLGLSYRKGNLEGYIASFKNSYGEPSKTLGIHRYFTISSRQEVFIGINLFTGYREFAEKGYYDKTDDSNLRYTLAPMLGYQAEVSGALSINITTIYLGVITTNLRYSF